MLTFFPQEIPPFETKGVMRASFSSRDVDNHTAFIRIKTNAPNEDQFIILPVEVEVTSGVLKTLWTHFLNYWCPLWAVRFTFFGFCFVFSCSSWYLLLHRDARLWYATVTRYDVQRKKRHAAVFLQKFFFGPLCSLALRSLFHLLCLADRPKLLNLHLLNSGAKDVPITVRVFSSLLNLKRSSQPSRNPVLYWCFTECTHNTIKWSRHNRFQSSHTESWREQIYQSCKYQFWW